MTDAVKIEKIGASVSDATRLKVSETGNSCKAKMVIVSGYVNDASKCRGASCSCQKSDEQRFPMPHREAPTMTVQEFETSYADRSRMSATQLALMGRFAFPCNCDEHECSGWQMGSVETMEDELRLGRIDGTQVQAALEHQEDLLKASPA